VFPLNVKGIGEPIEANDLRSSAQRSEHEEMPGAFFDKLFATNIKLAYEIVRKGSQRRNQHGETQLR
jgi:hypothetical protein